MTYKESEFPQMLEVLVDYIKKGIPVDEIVSYAYKLYKNVPIYIGIVNMCLENLVKEQNVTQLKKGDFVIIKDKNVNYRAVVEKIDKNNVYLKNVKIISDKKTLKVRIDNKQKVYKIEKDVLGKLLPSLKSKK
jgi:hypothetical protein